MNDKTGGILVNVSGFAMCCSFLLADRGERRPMEVAAKFLFKPVIWAFPTFISVPTSTVARAVLNRTLTPGTDKVELLDNKAIHRLQ